MDFRQRQNGGEPSSCRCHFLYAVRQWALPRTGAEAPRLTILEMFKINVKITVNYSSFEQYRRPFFALAHNADILPDSGTEFPLALAGSDYAQTIIQINIIFSAYYIICEHYRQSRTHTQQHKERSQRWKAQVGSCSARRRLALRAGRTARAKKAAPKDGLKKVHVSSEKAAATGSPPDATGLP